ncbi:MAG: SDR family oxidoreductase [Kofleriaceae bacterium]
MAQDLVGKVFIVTGANTGIGKITAGDLASRGGHVILACRSEAKTTPVVDEIKRTTRNDKVEFMVLDLADQASVRSFAEAFLARKLPLHGLINNAGLVTRGTTKEGFELIFGVNHLGHYLLTRLLLDHLKQTKGARVVNVSSRAHYRAKAIDWGALQKTTKTVSGFHEYTVSKLANVLFTQELAKRLEGSGVTTYAVHPGGVATDVWRRIPQPFRWLMNRFLISPEEGAKSTLRAATDPALATETGRYYTQDGSERRASRVATEDLARALWSKSAEWTGLPA